MNVWIRNILLSGFLAYQAVGAAAFDIEDYAVTFHAAADAFNRAAAFLRIAEADYEPIVPVAVANECIASSRVYVAQASADAIPSFSLALDASYASRYELGAQEEQDCESAYSCAADDLVCRSQRRACLAVAISRRRTDDLGEKTRAGIVEEFRATNLGAQLNPGYLDALRDAAVYADENGEAKFWADLRSGSEGYPPGAAGLVPTGQAVIDGLKADLSGTYTAEDIDKAFDTGFSQASGAAIRDDICFEYTARRDSYIRALNELALSYPPMVAAKAGYEAAASTYLSNQFCGANLPPGDWSFDN